MLIYGLTFQVTTKIVASNNEALDTPNLVELSKKILINNI
jgi:hypothetical protein